jgi:endonuclease-8
MPEGDNVHYTARSLHRALAGRVLTGCDIRVPAFATVDLTGQVVDEVVARGKHLLTRVGEVTVHSHLKMEGAWQVYRPGERWRRPAWQARIILSTADHVAVGFHLGLVEVIPRAEEHAVVGHLGPDPLGPDWDADEALNRMLADPARPVGLALLDQRVIAGLGNVYRAEVCFLRGVLPTRQVAEVNQPEKMVDLAHRLINANRDRTTRTTTGRLRGDTYWVYGRGGKPCLRCGTTVVRGELGDNELTMRATFYCPVCQT